MHDFNETLCGKSPQPCSCAPCHSAEILGMILFSPMGGEHQPHPQIKAPSPESGGFLPLLPAPRPQKPECACGKKAQSKIGTLERTIFSSLRSHKTGTLKSRILLLKLNCIEQLCFDTKQMPYEGNTFCTNPK